MENFESNVKNLFLTMVLPAPFGCNLKCPFCAIAQRGEAPRASVLQDSDYVRFLSDVASEMEVGMFSLQGYEPLLPEIWELTRVLLQVADDHDLGTSLVTNGVCLEERAEELSGLVDGIVVSLDSADESTHDKLRGVTGAWSSTVQGVRAAVEFFGDELTVNTVLFPKRSDYLTGMPKLLGELGVAKWVISPLSDFVRGGYRARPKEIQDVLLSYTAEAEKYGVEVYLGDDLRSLEEGDLYEILSAHALDGDDYVVRLSPDARCARGREILAPSAHAPLWDKTEEPHVFLERILAEAGRRL